MAQDLIGNERLPEEQELTELQILQLKIGARIRIGTVTTRVESYLRHTSFYTDDWFTDSYGNTSNCYGVDKGAEQYDIGKLPVYLVL